MKQVLNFLMVFLISISSKAQLSKKAAHYKIKEVSIPTRWTKQVSPGNALTEYPRPQLQRENWTNLNGLWDYAIVTEKGNVQKYDGKILVPYPLESVLSGVKKGLQPNQVLWYHRAFDNPILKGGEKLILNFGAVSWKATIFVNDKEAGNHKGAYSAFALDITGLLKAGKNDIKVKVWNPLEKGIGPRGKQTLEPGGMWYTASSGIWQTVWLEKVPENYIKSIKVTPDVDKGVVNVVVNAAGLGEASVKVFDSKREVALSTASSRNDAASSVIVRKDNEANSNLQSVTFTIPIKNAKLWSPDSPFLYDLEITMGKDKVKSYFGMRKIEIKKDDKGIDRIFLNNKYTYNLGVLDQGFWPDGLYTAPTDEALKFDIEAIKAMGFNTIRKHIKVEPARWYYHADKLGMLVWQDLVQPGGKLQRGGEISPDVKHQFEKESAEILEQLAHFPSITTWVLFNEKWGEYDQERLAKWIKSADQTRLVNGHSGAAIVNGKIEKGQIADVQNRSMGSDLTDVHSYPPPAIPNKIPGKAMVLGEFGGIGVQVNGHLWDDLQSVYGYGKTVSAGEMLKIYSKMVDSLVKFERQGLSASIYTQPYDVEGEQNGIMTYDRKVIKVPFEAMRNINGKLSRTTSMANLKITAADTGLLDFDEQVALYREGKRDSAFLRSLAIAALAKKHMEWAKTLSDEYIKEIKSPFIETNLKFIRRFTRNTTDHGFGILQGNVEKVNSILGKDAAEGTIMSAIERSEITPLIKGGKPDWTALEEKLVVQYGEIGKERTWESKVLYSYNEKQWKDFEEILMPWFEKYGHKRSWVDPGRFINNMAWGAFENINDKDKLQQVLKMTTYGLSIQPEDALLIDTHANLLYKLGRRDEAITWEQKAIDLIPDEVAFKETLDKMKNNVATWPNQ